MIASYYRIINDQSVTQVYSKYNLMKWQLIEIMFIVSYTSFLKIDKGIMALYNFQTLRKCPYYNNKLLDKHFNMSVSLIHIKCTLYYNLHLR